MTRESRILLATAALWLAMHAWVDAKASDTFEPYAEGEVPQTVSALWQGYDARHEPLDVAVAREWKADGVVTRYVVFTVGTFKGTASRIAAYYSFPDNGQKNAAFVWSHGGGQRAERERGIFFAKQGYATVDINWLGRPLEDGIEINTDWGMVDPTQGPQFYAKARRTQWKLNLEPDDHSLDPLPSPRNSNWFLLTVAARRAITFLEQQPEVDADHIGFAGFSMGGMITALTAIDPRLKAVVPFVGGTGFKDVDFPGGIEGSSLRPQLRHPELYRNTVDASSYWPLVRCPVCFISSSNDFHAAFDRIYQSLALLPHGDWRVSTNLHANHGPGPEQWVLLNLWFDQYLKGINQHIPPTPPSTFQNVGKQATFTVAPAALDRLLGTEIFFSYDPNSRSRFWNRADATQTGSIWSAELPIHPSLPLYAFASCRYSLGTAQTLQHGTASAFTLNSLEHVHLPDTIDRTALATLAADTDVFEDFRNGTVDWGSRDGRSITTYKFQSPTLDRSNAKKLVFTINPQGRPLTLSVRVESKFLHQPDNQGSFTAIKQVSGSGPREIVLRREDFTGQDGKTLEWAKIETFHITLTDTEAKQPITLTTKQGQSFLTSIRLVR